MTRNPNNIFIDTNVLIGAGRSLKKDTDCIHYLLSLNGKRLFISSLSFAQYVSVFQKRETNDNLKKKAKELLDRFNVLSFTEEDAKESLVESGGDLEDNIQHVISRKMKCGIFITNNVKDYRVFSGITVISPADVRAIRR
ncbi:MAG: PIN domain-containing protein [Bacteroidales bacterium]|nr:PIN domain-containing protein [Bacteroidales bacterium]